MFLTELFEAKSHNYLVIYPGRFQPFHKGHRAVYDYLVKKYGRDHVFIATSNKVAPPKSPFNFSQKAAMMRLTGVPMDRVVETPEPYRPGELVSRYSGDTRLLFAVSQKDMDEDPRFAKWTKKDGSPSYFQPMPKDPKDMQGLSQHGYIMIVPTFDFTVLGKPMRSATELRFEFAQADETTQKNIVKDLFGAYDEEVYSIMKHHINEEFGVGVVASRKQAKDPRYKTSLTVDVHPDTPRKNAKALGLV
ncbi:hypothetical protein EBR43_06490 [bacterium]|nr:hypothetical protein [bacterium]